MKLINALKRLANRRIHVQKDTNMQSDDYSFNKGSLVFCFTNITDEDTAIHFHAWDKETQETFYFKNFKNMMIYFDGVQEVQKVESVQEVKPKSKEVKGETPEIINKTIQFLKDSEKKGIPVLDRLTKEVYEEPETFGTCPYCKKDIIKSNSIFYEEYICSGCKIDFYKDEWLCIQEVICEAESVPVESENEVQNAERLI